MKLRNNKPAEPLIKDEKIRKVVRAWAELNGFDKVEHLHSEGMSGFYYEDIDERIDFLLDFNFPIAGLPVNEFYTIAELCGEEKE